MRHIKNYKELFEAQTELTREQITWLNKCAKKRWTLNPKTGLVDVNGDFRCTDQDLTDFKGVRFGEVTDTFDCSRNSLTSLEGAPQKVGESFYCSDNQITSLEGSPRIVRGGFNCSNNGITSLEGAPRKVGRDFFCSDNPVSEKVLKSLYGRIKKGMNWSDAVASYWGYIKSDEDKSSLAPYHPNLSPEEIKGYEALAKFRKKII